MHNVMTVCGSHYRRQPERCQIVRWGRAADFYAESTDIFQVRTALIEMKIENAGPEPTLKIQFSKDKKKTKKTAGGSRRYLAFLFLTERNEPSYCNLFMIRLKACQSLQKNPELMTVSCAFAF